MSDFWWGMFGGFLGTTTMYLLIVHFWSGIKALVPARTKRRSAMRWRWELSKNAPKPERNHAVTQRDSVPESVARDSRTKVRNTRGRRDYR